MDDLFPKPRKKNKYDEDCKGRFRANLTKLCSNGFLKYVGKRKEKPSVTIVTYKILRCPGDKPAKVMSKRKRKTQLNMDKTVVNMSEEIGNPAASFNGNSCPSIDYLDINLMQLREIVYAAYSNNIEEIVNPGASFNGSNYPNITCPNIAMQGNTTYGNNIEEIENPGASFNGNSCPSTDHSDNNLMQLRDVVYTAYSNNIKEIENSGASFNENNFPSIDYTNIAMQMNTTCGNNSEENENAGASLYGNNYPSIDYLNIAMQGNTTYGNNCTKGVGDLEENMIVHKNPVLSSAWEKEEKDNADFMKGSPGFLLSEDDWMEYGNLNYKK